MARSDRLAWSLTLVLGVAIAGVLYTRAGTPAQRSGAAPAIRTDAAAAARAHEAAGVRIGADAPTGPVAPGFQRRIDSLRARLDESPDDPDRLVELARTLHDGHRPTEAVTLYRRALAADPTRVDVAYDLAAALAEAGDWDEAAGVLERRVAEAPDDAVALYDLGAIRANTGDSAGARGWFGRAAEAATDPDLRRRAQQALTRLGAGG